MRKRWKRAQGVREVKIGYERYGAQSDIDHFKQMMTIEPEKGMKKINNSFLEIARQDHAEIVKRMNK